jgi:UDP-N-acetylglucosamine 4,6-dehydratase
MSIFDISRNKKQALMIVADIFLVILSLWLAFALRLSEWFWPNESQLWLFILGPILALFIFIKLGLYRAVIRYIGYKAMLAVVQAVTALVVIWLVISITILPLYIGVERPWFPRSIPILFWMTLLLTVGGSRQGIRWLLSPRSSAKTVIRPKKNVLIYGAGRAGIELAASLAHNEVIQLLGFIDDDPSLNGHYVQNLEVLGDRTEIEKIRAKINPLEVLLATPNTSDEGRKGLLKYLETKRVTVRTIPSLADITSRTATVDDLRDVDISDLLPRKAVVPNQKLLATCITSKKILVTGAGGSIGSELCRQILSLNPTLIILFEHSEINLYKINTELVNQCIGIDRKVKIIPLLGSITNKQRVENTIKSFEVDTIYHAAAYKHVTLIENNIEEGVLNNIFGTYNVAQAAIDLHVENFILISTDKAVNPTSAMGATKRIAELITQGLSQKNKSECIDGNKFTHMVIVRFGNVLGSSGSVIPLFQKQIAAGGPITITHPEVTRYFMTIPEASQLVLQAGSIDFGGNCSIFALNMGEPVLILSLAKQLVYLSGHMLKMDESSEEESSIEIQYTGLQKGEKIHEELFIGDNITSTDHPMILEAQEELCTWIEIEKMLAELGSHLNLNDKKLRQLLMQYAIKNYTYKPTQFQ